jgi:hypothetical protein
MKPLPLLRLLGLACLAACTERGETPRAPEGGDSASAAAAVATATSAGARDEPWPGLPDFGEPRRFLSLDSLRWAEVEDPVAGDRLARLRALGIPVVQGGEVEESPADFHFVDFSGDGVQDVVYNGPWIELREGEVAAMEGDRLLFYQVIGGRAVQVFEAHAALQRIWRGSAGEPIRFRAVQYGCCAETHLLIEYYRPEVRGDTVRYRLHHRILGSAETVPPTRFLARPRRFTVAQDRYTLRYSPEIGAEEGVWEGHGNASAEYGRGARGVALAEATDATGRVWWYVLMDGRTPPLDASPEGWPEEAPQDRLGWMSSRFVTEEPGP